MKEGTVWVVCGPPGSGKTTVCELLLGLIRPVPALLDKDTMYGSFVTAALADAGRDPGEREGRWYNEHVKRHEYDGMTATAREIRSYGCGVLLSGPYTDQIRDPARWEALIEAFGGGDVRLVWIRSNAETLLARLRSRGSHRDTGKLAAFEAYVARVRPEEPPPVAHHEVDNRLSAPLGLRDQLDALIHHWSAPLPR